MQNRLKKSRFLMTDFKLRSYGSLTMLKIQESFYLWNFHTSIRLQNKKFFFSEIKDKSKNIYSMYFITLKDLYHLF